MKKSLNANQKKKFQMTLNGHEKEEMMKSLNEKRETREKEWEAECWRVMIKRERPQNWANGWASELTEEPTPELCMSLNKYHEKDVKSFWNAKTRKKRKNDQVWLEECVYRAKTRRGLGAFWDKWILNMKYRLRQVWMCDERNGSRI